MELNGDFEYVDDVTQKSIQRYIVKQNDIILAIVGNTLGLVSMVGKSLDSANLTENCVKIVSDNLTTQNYIYYYLNSDFGQNEIKKLILSFCPIPDFYPITSIIILPNKQRIRRQWGLRCR